MPISRKKKSRVNWPRSGVKQAIAMKDLTPASLQISLARWLHISSAIWTLALTGLIFFDVTGRGLFSSPIPGTKEIIQNSVVCITFLQIPLAIFSGSMLRTTVFIDKIPPAIAKWLRVGVSILGLLVFLGMLWATYPSYLDAYDIGEYEGEGALRVPTWPVRGLVLIMSGLSTLAYLSMIVLDIQNKLIGGVEARGALEPATEANGEGGAA